MKLFQPETAATRPTDYSLWFRCPKCAFTSHLYGFDVLGADDGKLFCPRCNHHGRMRHLSERTAERYANTGETQ